MPATLPKLTFSTALKAAHNLDPAGDVLQMTADEAEALYCYLENELGRRGTCHDLIRNVELFLERRRAADEEARYYVWIADDGPAKAEKLHRDLADASLCELGLEGWRLLERRMVRRSFADFEVVEAVVRRGDELRVLRWHTFNKGWMTPSPCGGEVIFDGEKV